jgi:hypothetical protein
MKTGKVLFSVGVCIACVSVSLAQSTNPAPKEISDEYLNKERIKPIGDWTVDSAETQELNQVFASALAAGNSIPASPDWGAQRHAVNNALRAELETFPHGPSRISLRARHPRLARARSTIGLWLLPGNESLPKRF